VIRPEVNQKNQSELQNPSEVIVGFESCFNTSINEYHFSGDEGFENQEKPTEILNISSEIQTKALNKIARIQDISYIIKGELLKQNYSSLHSSYKKSTKCGEEIEITLEDGKTKIRCIYYCNQRWCPRCARIRSAKLIDAYTPIIAKWVDLYLVTLTVSNVSPFKLRDKLTEMQKRFRNIMRTIHREFGTSAIKLIKTIEVTANIETRKVHPHYHLLVESREVAIRIRKLWVERSLKDNDEVVWAAQDVTKASSPKEAALELFKYVTKFMEKKGHGKDGELVFDGWLQDKIYVGLYHKHCVQAFGFEKPKTKSDEEEVVEDKDEEPVKRKYATWKPAINQYIFESTGEIISDYKRLRIIKRLVSKIREEKEAFPMLR